MSSISIEGSCLCGNASYRISGAPLNFFHCHCRRCRKANGTGHASNILVKPESVEWLSGGDDLGDYKVPDAKRFRSVFCNHCGSPLPRVTPDLNLAVIPAGSVDSELTLMPNARIFWDSRANWSCGADAVQEWPEYPQPAS